MSQMIFLFLHKFRSSVAAANYGKLWFSSYQDGTEPFFSLNKGAKPIT